MTVCLSTYDSVGVVPLNTGVSPVFVSSSKSHTHTRCGVADVDSDFVFVFESTFSFSSKETSSSAANHRPHGVKSAPAIPDPRFPKQSLMIRFGCPFSMSHTMTCASGPAHAVITTRRSSLASKLRMGFKWPCRKSCVPIFSGSFDSFNSV